MSKILKNTTNNSILIPDTGVAILANSSYAIQPMDYQLWAQSSDLIVKIAEGSIIVNNGNSDLSISNGVSLIQGSSNIINFGNIITDSSVASAISSETARASAAEYSLNSLISAETSRAASAESSVDVKISSETSRAQSSEGSLLSLVSAETSRSVSSENSLSSIILAEISRAQSSESLKLTKGSKTILCLDNGDYATGQDAIDAASAGSTILFGAKSTSWGDLVIPAGKTLSLIGLTSPRASSVVTVGAITFSPSTGTNPNANELSLSNLFISAPADSVSLTFGGTAPARLRVSDCYFYSNNSSNLVLSNSNATQSSAYIYDCQFGSQSSSITNIQSSVRYVHINRCNVANGNKAVVVTGGLLELQSCRLEVNSSSEIISVSNSNTVLSIALSLISNSTSNGSGVLANSGAIFQQAYNTFNISTGTGYCVRGSGIHMYGPMLFNNSALLAGNVKVQSTLTSVPFTTTFTSTP